MSLSVNVGDLQKLVTKQLGTYSENGITDPETLGVLLTGDIFKEFNMQSAPAKPKGNGGSKKNSGTTPTPSGSGSDSLLNLNLPESQTAK